MEDAGLEVEVAVSMSTCRSICVAVACLPQNLQLLRTEGALQPHRPTSLSLLQNWHICTLLEPPPSRGYQQQHFFISHLTHSNPGHRPFSTHAHPHRLKRSTLKQDARLRLRELGLTCHPAPRILKVRQTPLQRSEDSRCEAAGRSGRSARDPERADRAMHMRTG